jgi:hypothetical protein
MIDRFGDRIKELESVVREIAIDITTGTVVDRLPPEKVWETTGPKVSMVRELIKELREYLYILKPEKVPTIQRNVTGIFERLDLFQESLTLDRGIEGKNSQVSVDELRKALSEISEFVSLCRAIHPHPQAGPEVRCTVDNPGKDEVPGGPRQGGPVLIRRDHRAVYQDRASARRDKGRVRGSLFQP